MRGGTTWEARVNPVRERYSSGSTILDRYFRFILWDKVECGSQLVSKIFRILMSKSCLDLQPSVQTLLHHNLVQLFDLGKEDILVANDYDSSESMTVASFNEGEEGLVRSVPLPGRFVLRNDPIGSCDRYKTAARDDSL
jgi:hypothetical protein